MDVVADETAQALNATNTETPRRVEGAAANVLTADVTETSDRMEGDDGGAGQETRETPSLVDQNQLQLQDGGEDDDGEPAAKKPGFDLPEIPREEDKGKWILPEDLAAYFASNTKRHTTDKDMLAFMHEYPTPSNVDCVPRLDESAKRSLKDKNLNPVIDIDEDFTSLQKKVQDIMGPLGAAWGILRLWKTGQCLINEETEKSLVDQIDKAVILTAHTMQRISWHRRVHVLSAIGKTNGAKNADIRALLKQDKIQQIFQNDSSGELFGKQFDEVTKSENTSRSNFAALFQPKKKAEPKKTSTTSSASTSRKRPFSANPSPRGGGYQQQSRQDGYSSNPFRRGGNGYGSGNSNSSNSNSFFNRRGSSYNKGNFVETTFCQHALSSNMAPIVKTRAPGDKGCFSNNGSYFTFGRENSKIPGQLENTNQRQSYFGYSKGMGGTTEWPSISNPFTSGNKDEEPRGESHGSGNREHACKRGYQGGHSEIGPVSEQCFRNSERRGGVSTNNKSERPEPVRSLPPFQDGRIKGREESLKEGGLDVQNGSKGCLLFGSPQHPLPQTGSFSMERNPLRISLPGFRTGTSPEDFHKTHEGPHIHLKKTGSVPGHLPRRPFDNGSIEGKINDGARYNNVSFSPSRPHYQSKKVHSRTYSVDRVSGRLGGQHGALLPVAGEEDPKVDFKVSRSLRAERNDLTESLLLDRKAEVHSSSCLSGPITNPFSTATVHSSTSSAPALRIIDSIVSRGEAGDKMVAGKLGTLERKPNAFSTTRDDHMLGCSEAGRLGGCLPPGVHGRPMDGSGKVSEHKCTGAE